MTLNVLEAEIRHAMDLLSNNEEIEVKDEWIDNATELFREAMYKQFRPREQQDFSVRMSNIGRPLCQLQRAKEGADRARLPYNHVMKMALGDATEAIMEIIIRAAGLNVTGGKRRVRLQVAGTEIKGENDVEIDGKVWDTKSCSPWAFENKWPKGVEGLKQYDDFGYLGQLTGYATADGREPGGWFVVNKSTGEVSVVPAPLTEREKTEILTALERKVEKLVSDTPFERGFEPEEETYYRKPTGSKRVPMTCTFCDFMRTCWPEAQLKPQTGSKARDPKLHWYVEYAGDK